MNDIDDSEALVRKAMDGSGEWYTIRVGLAWDQLSINELRDRVIPAADLAERLSNVLGRPISRELFLEYCQQRPEDPKVVAAMARVLDVDALWLRAETAKPD